MKPIITILLCAALALAPIARAEDANTGQDSQIIVALVDSRPAHWWKPLGQQIYQYRTVDGHLIELPKLIEKIPDNRTWEKRHPVKSRLQEGINWSSGIGNLLKLIFS